MVEQRRILVTNGRYPITLDLMRNLSACGHKIYLAESRAINLSRYSNVVEKHFVVPSPRFEADEHIAALVEIITREKIDLFIPIWEDIFLISKHLDKFPTSCQVFCKDYPLLLQLHNKGSFIELLEKLNIPTPKTQTITDKSQLEKIQLPAYVLKPCYSRASLRVYLVNAENPVPDIEPELSKPWVAQEWLAGKNYCSFSICFEGKVMAHSAYPMDFVKKKKKGHSSTVGGYCLSFRAIHHEKIFLWIKNFVDKIHFTGHIAFDFIEMPDGRLYAIECNPRTTSGICLFSKEDRIDMAYKGENPDLIVPKLGTNKQIALPNVCLGWKMALHCKKFPLYLYNVLVSKDVIFNWKDIKPFLMQPVVWINHAFLSFRLRKRIVEAFTHDLDFNG